MRELLLVDDDADMRMMTAMWLKKEYAVREADSGEAAIQALHERKPELVLLDYAMPGMDGPETLRRIREDAAIADVRVAFLTGKEAEEYREEMAILSPAGILPKSSGRKALLQEVDRLFNK